MKNYLLYIFFFLTSLSVVSCNPNGVDPQKTFDVCGISLNKIPYKFKQHFNEIRGQIKNGSLTYVTKNNEVKKGVTATEYVENRYVDMFKKDIQDIKDLKVDDETRPIQQAALDVFNYSQEVYRTDVVRIAKMIDEGKTDAEIDLAIEELQNTKGKIIDEKFNKTHEMVFPCADKHGIEYETLDYPF